MSTYVADTHSLVWYFSRPGRLGTGAVKAFSEVRAGQSTLLLPVIVLAELILAIESGRVNVDFDAMLRSLRAIPNVQILDFTLERAIDLSSLTIVQEMHDRMIVAEAIAHNAVLITRDQAIFASGIVSTTW